MAFDEDITGYGMSSKGLLRGIYESEKKSAESSWPFMLRLIYSSSVLRPSRLF